MVQLADGWQLDVERGPDWLFVRPQGVPVGDDATPSLGEAIWDLLEQNFTHRLVLEMQNFDRIDARVIGQLVWLDKRIQAAGGMMRLAGLSKACQKVLHRCRLDSRFPECESREVAVMGSSRTWTAR